MSVKTVIRLRGRGRIYIKKHNIKRQPKRAGREMSLTFE